MASGVSLCMLCVCVCGEFNVLVCGVCGLAFAIVWFVVLWFAVICDVMCGVVWFVLFVCVPVLCVCVLFVICCVMVYGVSFFLCPFCVCMCRICLRIFMAAQCVMLEIWCGCVLLCVRFAFI